METNFSIFAIPIVFFAANDLDEKKLNHIFYFFVSGLLVASGICFVKAIVAFQESRSIGVFLSYQFTDIINSHPTYLAYYIIFAMTFGLYLLYYEKTDINSYLIVGILIFLFVILMLTGGRTAFISILLIFAFFILIFINGNRAISQKITFGLVVVMLASMFLVSAFDWRGRNSEMDDSWERFALWESAISATPNIIWGVGTGDYKLLNHYYRSHNLIQYAEGSYNAHNQFIQIFFTNGVIGLMSVLILICRPLYLAVKNQHVLGVLVFFPFLIYGTTEVFLGRYQGVVFFALLHQVFISYYSSLKPSLTSLKGV